MAPQFWTLEQRIQQSEAIRRWMPWKQSTGPRTSEGKATTSQNAVKHGATGIDAQALERLLGLLKRDRVAIDEGLKKWGE